MNAHRLLAFAAWAAVAAGFSIASPAIAASSFDACTYTISSLPVVISNQGHWCLKGDASTAIASGVAIDIQANNVLLDCNGFKIGGFAAGVGTGTTGIQTTKLNTVIRNCNVRGFRTGIVAGGAAGTIEDSRVEGSTAIGIESSSGTIIRRNRVLDTGGSPGAFIYAIVAVGGGEVTGNQVDGTVPGGENVAGGTGIYAVLADGMVIRDNIVQGIHATGSAARPLLVQSGTHVVVTGNVVSGPGASSIGISCPTGSLVILRRNTVFGFNAEDSDCTDAGGNWFN